MTGEAVVLAEAAGRCLAVLSAHRVSDGERVGWGTWELDANADPVGLNCTRPSLYDGNVGIAWAMRLMGVDPGQVVTGAEPPGLLGGAAGTVLAGGGTLPSSDVDRGNDLGDGIAGDLLVLVRTGSTDTDRVACLVEALARAAVRIDDMACWGDPRLPADRPLCGLAHGASGIAIALAEAAVAYPSVAPVAVPLIGDALRWESAWYDPVHGWPDLRADGGGYPVLWCHGAGGIGATRLRLLELARMGLDLDYPADAVAAEASAAVLACGRELTRAVGVARKGGLASVPYGLTLCHGAGGLLDVLVQAAEVWDEPGHLQAARRIAVDLLATAPEDPLEWPSGLKAPGCLGLFVGVAGTALLLTRLADPTGMGTLSLLGPFRQSGSVRAVTGR
ncbi:Lanthionine synthetase C-like protein [Tessaracoccus bendigoensis DSM 12906]|uniref:Lanthionine synthetase C-like protein n=1 Tax=Tessaracoccus bendigoensis DSM 12906 TaxID=1123357 RepID=A0A1M6GT41_9ACTN|nr:lanthionine synthetase LanC family protein [Tessaracoccus bendigoensis]SHJ13145.1 Lanthionine synthetase C-like protein [Tessaracoccus bendigoensis DSM 12906]